MRNSIKFDEHQSLNIIAVLVGKLARDAEERSAMTRGQILDFCENVQAVLLQIEPNTRKLSDKTRMRH